MISIAERLFDADIAQAELADSLIDAHVPYERMEWDYYDCSLELYGVPADYRLSDEGKRIIESAGFRIAYLNHLDKWETHYGLPPTEGNLPFRVSYPHKRGPEERGIWTERVIESWPKEWFEGGYAVVKLSNRSEEI